MKSNQINFIFVTGTAWYILQYLRGTAKVIRQNFAMFFMFPARILKYHAKYRYLVCYGYTCIAEKRRGEGERNRFTLVRLGLIKLHNIVTKGHFWIPLSQFLTCSHSLNSNFQHNFINIIFFFFGYFWCSRIQGICVILASSSGRIVLSLLIGV